MSVILGIDPGNSGALAWLDEDGRVTLALRMPMLAKDPNPRGLVDAIATASAVVYENTRGVRPVRFKGKDGEERTASGHKAAESRGLYRGLILGICAALDVPCYEVRPQEWQKSLALGKLEYSERKAKIARLAQERWPTIPMKFKADWGMADAAFIADYGRTRQLWLE